MLHFLQVILAEITHFTFPPDSYEATDYIDTDADKPNCPLTATQKPRTSKHENPASILQNSKKSPTGQT